MARLIEPFVSDLVDCNPDFDRPLVAICDQDRPPLPPELASDPDFQPRPRDAPYLQLRDKRLDEPRTFQTDDIRVDSERRGPALISLHSGMWDIALFGREDQGQGSGMVEGPLSPQRLRWWRDRMINLIRVLKKTFPNSPIWLRTIHRTGTNLTRNDWSQGLQYGQIYFLDM